MNIKNIWIGFILLVAIVVFVLLLSQDFYTRLDFSKGKIYSLVESSKDAVKNLDDRLVIKAYFSADMPPQYADLKRFTQNKLEEYKAYGGSNIEYEFVDPKDKEALKLEAQKYGIQPLRMQVNEKDKIEVREVYMGLAFLYKDNDESIPAIQSTEGLEYIITKTIKQISAQKMKKLAFFTTDKEEIAIGRGQLGSPYKTMREVISESYEIFDTDLEEALPTDTDVLLVASTKDTLSENQLFNLDQYLMKNGDILIFQDRVIAELQTQRGTINNSNIFDLLEHYGVKAKDNLVADAECGAVSIPVRVGFLQIPQQVKYPYIPIITNMNEENILVKNLDVLIMSFVSEIDTTAVKNDFEPLLFSSNNTAQSKAPRFDLGIQKYMQAKNLKNMLNEKQKVLAGMYSGKFTSYFAESDTMDVIAETEDGKLIFVPSGSFIREDGGINNQSNNIDFLQNAVDYLAGDEALIQLRSRKTEFQPLKVPESAIKRLLIKWANILLPSILLIIYGFLRWHMNESRKKKIGELYE